MWCGRGVFVCVVSVVSVWLFLLLLLFLALFLLFVVVVVACCCCVCCCVFVLCFCVVCVLCVVRAVCSVVLGFVVCYHGAFQNVSLSTHLDLSSRLFTLTRCRGLTLTFARVLVRAHIDGPGSQPTDAVDHTSCVSRALMPTSAVQPPHVCHRQRDGAVSISSRMQQDMDIF